MAITITPGAFVTNLTGLPLLLHPEGTARATRLACSPAAAGSRGAAAAAAAATPYPATSSGLAAPAACPVVSSGAAAEPLAAGATLPLLHLWGADPPAAAGPSDGQGEPVHRRVRSWGGADLLRTFSSAGALSTGAGSSSANRSSPADTPLPSPGTGVPPLQLHRSGGGVGAKGGPAPAAKPALRFAVVPLSAGGCAAAGHAQEAAAAGGVQAAGDSGQAAAGGAPAAAAPAAAQPGEPAWSSGVDPFQAVERQRLYLQVGLAGRGGQRKGSHSQLEWRS